MSTRVGAEGVGSSFLCLGSINQVCLIKPVLSDEDFPETNNLEVLWKNYPEFLGYRFVHEHESHEHANFNTSELLLELEP